MASAFSRIPRKLAIVFMRRDTACPLLKALGDIWRGHLRSRQREKMRKKLVVLESDDAGNELWATPLGEMWAPPNSGLEMVFTEILSEVYASPSRMVKVLPGDTVIDCGAHVGVFCRYAISIGARKVIAIEITSATRSCLERNLANEIADGRAIIVSQGVWSEETVLELSISNGSLGNTVVMERATALGTKELNLERVPVTTIDALTDRLNIDRVDFIKMDIEGAERHALHGAAGTLRRFGPRIAVASYHLPDDRDAIADAVSSARKDFVEELGQCLILHDQVLPETLFYRPRELPT
jgi:FkbM family methyltransferase